MGMMFQLEYHSDVLKEDIPKLSRKEKNTVQSAIWSKLTTRPEVFGKPLRGSRRGYRKLRVGNYRVIFRLEEMNVKIFAIMHRSTVYRDVWSRT